MNQTIDMTWYPTTELKTGLRCWCWNNEQHRQYSGYLKEALDKLQYYPGISSAKEDYSQYDYAIIRAYMLTKDGYNTIALENSRDAPVECKEGDKKELVWEFSLDKIFIPYLRYLSRNLGSFTYETELGIIDLISEVIPKHQDHRVEIYDPRRVVHTKLPQSLWLNVDTYNRRRSIENRLYLPDFQWMLRNVLTDFKDEKLSRFASLLKQQCGKTPGRKFIGTNLDFDQRSYRILTNLTAKENEMTKKHWTSGLNRDDMLKDLEVNLGKIVKSQQQALIALAEELDSELLDCAENHGRLDQPNKEYVASVVYIKGDFYGDLETGVINHAEIKPDLVDAARKLGLLDEDGYDYDALIALSEWSYHWPVE